MFAKVSTYTSQRTSTRPAARNEPRTVDAPVEEAYLCRRSAHGKPDHRQSIGQQTRSLRRYLNIEPSDSRDGCDHARLVADCPAACARPNTYLPAQTGDNLRDRVMQVTAFCASRHRHWLDRKTRGTTSGNIALASRTSDPAQLNLIMLNSTHRFQILASNEEYGPN